MSFSTLIDAATLRANLGRDGWVIFDVRHQLADTGYGERVYGEGHIPGAVFLHCDRDLSAPLTGHNGRHPLPGVADFCARLGACGVSSRSQVVVYDDAQGMIAGRLWWMLRALGHRQVAVLDGGWQAWLEAGGETLAGQTARPLAVECDLAPAYAGLIAVDEVLTALGASDRLLVDARSADRFRGENETIDPVGGHIPGAINRCFRDNLLPDGRLKPAEVLRQEWLLTLRGRAPEAVVHQCGSGVSACLNALAMEVAGLPGSALYAGSWSEWCSDPARPVATGAA